MLLHFDPTIFIKVFIINKLNQNPDPLDPLVTHSRGSGSR
jgi:hypothetical protein